MNPVRSILAALALAMNRGDDIAQARFLFEFHRWQRRQRMLRAGRAGGVYRAVSLPEGHPSHDRLNTYVPGGGR